MTSRTPGPDDTRKPTSFRSVGCEDGPGGAVEILPMQLLVGDRFTDEEGDWEVTGRPYTTGAGKLVHVSIQRPGEQATAREKTWGAHERLTIQRATATPSHKPTPKTEREFGKHAKG